VIKPGIFGSVGFFGPFTDLTYLTVKLFGRQKNSKDEPHFILGAIKLICAGTKRFCMCSYFFNLFKPDNTTKKLCAFFFSSLSTLNGTRLKANCLVYLRQGSIVPYVSMIWEAVMDKSELSLFTVLLNRIQGFLCRNL